MSDYRISMEFSDGSAYSYIEKEAGEWVSDGAWSEPFHNDEDSCVYGILEAGGQGEGPLSIILWQSGEPLLVTIKKL